MRVPSLIFLTTVAFATHASEPMHPESVQVQCGTDHVAVKSNHARLVDVLESLSECLGFTLAGTSNIDTVELRQSEISGTPSKVLKAVLEGINVLIVGNEHDIDRVIVLSADHGFVPPTEPPAALQEKPAPVPISSLQRNPSTDQDDLPGGIDITTETANGTVDPPSEPTIADVMERRALAATKTTAAHDSGGGSPNISRSTDHQEYLPELTRQSQEQLKALLNALDRVGASTATSPQ